MDEIAKNVSEFFREKWSSEHSEPGFAHISWLLHFDGRMHWQAQYDSKENYLWITAGVEHGADHVLESHGRYESCELKPMLSPTFESGEMKMTDKESNVLILYPCGSKGKANITWICRHAGGRIELEMHVGFPNNAGNEV